MKRLLSVSMVLVVLLSAASSAVAGQAPRIPRDASEWASFTDAEKRAAVDYQWQLLQESLANGTAVIHTETAAALPTALGDADAVAAVSVTARCSVQWIDQVAGSWVRGGGWTDASDNIYRIYASRSAKKGQFLKDGVLKGTWWEDKAGGSGFSHAESWSAYDYKWAFESFNYTVKGWHGAQLTSGGTWLLGPDAYCTLTVHH